MSGNHKRKRRKMMREWRYNAIINLITLLHRLKVDKNPDFGERRKKWDYACRFDR